MFRDNGGLGQRSLFDVLRAYSVYDVEVGYCQGMGFVTGLFLCHLNSEDSFWLLVALMRERALRGVFRPGLPKFDTIMYQFDCAMQKIMPKLSNHLTVEGIHPSMYASQC